MERKRMLLYAIFQVIPLLILPPSILFSQGGISSGAIALFIGFALIFVALGWGLMRGRGWALTMSIFIQGLNVIIRLMMVFPNAVSKQGVWDPILIILFLISIAGSAWLMVRLDRPDIRSMIVS